MKQIFCVTDDSIRVMVHYEDTFIAALADAMLATNTVPFLHLAPDNRVVGHYDAVFQPMVVEALRLLYKRHREQAFKLPDGVFVQHGQWYVEGCVGNWTVGESPYVPHLTINPFDNLRPPWTITSEPIVYPNVKWGRIDGNTTSF